MAGYLKNSFGFCTDKNKKTHHIVTALLLILVFSFKPVLAQTNKEVINTFTVINEKISDAVIKLSNQSNLNFSYDASDISLNKRITYSAKGKTVTAILDEILKNTGNTFKRIGNQIVIYKSTNNKDNSTSNEPNNPVKKKTAIPKPVKKPIPEVKTILKTDTLLVIDTLIVHDTVVRTDTVRIVDTVTLKKENPKSRKAKKFPVDYFSMQDNREKGWAFSVFYAPLLTRFTFAQEEKPLSLRSFMLGGNTAYMKKNWDLSFGIKLTHFANRFTFSHTVTEGGFYLADTIDAYYTITGTDTSWYYVTDSVWQPLKTYESGYDKINRIGYLEFNLSSAYKFYKTKNKTFYVRLGIQLGFPVYENGIAIVNSEAIDFQNITFGSPVLSTLAGTGIKYKVYSTIDVFGEVFYTKYFRPMTNDLPTEIYPDNLGLKMGVVFYFR
jgi:hypothetical protein